MNTNKTEVQQKMLKALDKQIINPLNDANGEYILGGFTEHQLEAVKQFVGSFYVNNC